MAEMVSRRPLAAVALTPIHRRVRMGFVVDGMALGQVSVRVGGIFLRHYHCSNSPYSVICHQGYVVSALVSLVKWYS